jgi:glucokinase
LWYNKAVSKPSRTILVYDVGGSHISAALCAEHDYSLHGITSAPLPSAPEGSHGHFSAASFGRLIHALAESASNTANIPFESVAGASLAMPGPFDYANGISQMKHKLVGLYGVNLKSALAARFHWQPDQVRFVNDAAAFLLGEMGAGAAKGYDRAIGITLGTGIGCAFGVSDPAGSRVLTEGQGVPPGGEIWNLPYNGATVEDFVSTRYLRAQYQSLTGLEAEVAIIADAAKGDQPSPPCPDDLPPLTPVPGAPEDPYLAHCRARRAFENFGRHLGLALNQHAAAFHPDVIVLGGGISRASALFLPSTRKALAPGFAPRIAISTLMDHAPLAGAGVHWFTA